MKTKDSVRCDEVQKLPPERSQRSLRNQRKVGAALEKSAGKLPGFQWLRGTDGNRLLGGGLFLDADVIWIFNVFAVY